MKTGLIRTVDKALGKNLLAAAVKENQQNATKMLVGVVSGFLVQIEKQERYIAQSQENIEFLRRKVAAIEKGEFEASTYGNMITFHDAKLNKSVDGMAECPNCGANLARLHR